MIRIFNTMPQRGSVVIAKITTVDKVTQMHDCILLEYGDMPAIIIRADCNSKAIRTLFINIKVGMIVPLVCHEVPILGSLFVAVSYPSLDKESIQKYKNNYNGIMRVINSITMMLPISHLGEISRPDEILEADESIRKSVQQIIDEIIASFESVDELMEAFYSDTVKLHTIVKTWKKCAGISEFEKKMLCKFPLPKESVTLRFEYVNYYCNGIQKIKEMITKVDQLIHVHDQKVTVKIAIDTVPFYRVIIKEIDTDNLKTYVERLKETLNETQFDETFEIFKIESEELQSTKKIEELE